MTIKIGINGFGRIGRLVLRAALDYPTQVEVVGINDIAETKALAHLLKYDSVHGTLKNNVTHDEKTIFVDGKPVRVSKEKDPANLPWRELGAEIIVESTGFFTEREKAMAHIGAGAKRVIISAPAKGVDATFVVGVNQKTYDPARHIIVSNASCTTNCLAPMIKVLQDSFGVKRGLMTTIHAYTNDQRTNDQIHSDPRRMRAAAINMIPTKTGAAAAIGEVIPALKGKLDGYAMRVPVPNVSATDLTVELEKAVTKEEINGAFKAAAEGGLKNILAYSEEPLVSTDYNHSSYSSIIDALSTKVLDGNFVKTLSWYDNEWGYSCRVVELALVMADKK